LIKNVYKEQLKMLVKTI